MSDTGNEAQRFEEGWLAAWKEASEKWEPAVAWMAREFEACSAMARLLAEALYRGRTPTVPHQRFDGILLQGENVVHAFERALVSPSFSEVDARIIGVLARELEDARLLANPGLGQWHLVLGKAWEHETLANFARWRREGAALAEHELKDEPPSSVH